MSTPTVEVKIDAKFGPAGIEILNHRLRRTEEYGNVTYDFSARARIKRAKLPSGNGAVLALDEDGLILESWFAELEPTVDNDIYLIHVNEYMKEDPAEIQLVWKPIDW